MTPSDVFIPERALMSSLSLDATIRISRGRSASRTWLDDWAELGATDTRRRIELPSLEVVDVVLESVWEAALDTFVDRGEGVAATDLGVEVTVVPDSPDACCSRCHVARSGERFSTAYASRWRIIGRCISQHPTEQKTIPVRLRLHVDTLQT